MDRRQFLAMSAGVGVAAVAGGLGAFPGVADAARTGYRVGQKMPTVTGPDQFGKIRAATDGKSWTLIDVCAAWCGPSKRSASWQSDFLQYIRGKHIPIRLVTVLAQDGDMYSPNRRQAEHWAHLYGLMHEVVMHPDGSPTSPLLSLVTLLGAANGNPDVGYPTYVLLSPDGVIRWYQTSTDLNLLQTQLAKLTHKHLTQVWPEDGKPGIPPLMSRNGAADTATSITLSGVGQNVGAFSELAGFDPLVVVATTTASLPYTDVVIYLADVFSTTDTFDLQFDNEAPLPGRVLRRISAVGHTAYVGPAAEFDPIRMTVDLHTVLETGTPTSTATGFEETMAAIDTVSGGSDDTATSAIALALAYTGARTSLPYGMAAALHDDFVAADPGVDASVASAVSALYAGVTNALATRKYGQALSKAMAAATALRNTGAPAHHQVDADWLVTYLATL